MGKRALSDHKFKKNVFTTPLNQLNLELQSWYKERAPEYFWIALIINHYGRKKGLERCMEVSKILRQFSPEPILPRFSVILSLDEEKQTEFFKSISGILDAAVFAPITLLITYSKNPIFSEFFLSPKTSLTERLETLKEVWGELSRHQSELSTDVRFVAIFHALSSGKIIIEGGPDQILSYPSLNHDDKKMQIIRPTVRVLEEMHFGEEPDEKYLREFWESVGRMDECELYCLDFSTEVVGMDEYISYVKKVMQYYTDIFVSSQPHNNKMLVLLGIATYSYKRLLELVKYRLCHSIVGRSISRVLVEDYIMMKYLLKEEPNHKDIWLDFQLYGLGKYKMVVERYKASGKKLDKGHIEFDYLDMLVREYRSEQFINVDLNYFDNKNVRDKAIYVDEKDLFDHSYDYDSSYEHGLWGAIRESSLIRCNSPLHQYNCVPDLENQQNVKSVAHDCKMTMEKIIGVLCNEYGAPPFLIRGGEEDE